MSDAATASVGLPRVTVKDLTYHLPENVVTNEDLQQQFPEWDMTQARQYAGVQERHLARSDETALDLGHQAALKLFARHEGLQDRIDALIFSTQSPDHILPPNACILHKRLALSERVLAFDVNLGCSAFPYCLVVARGLILSGAANNVLVVVGDTTTKYMNANDRSSRVLFGDGATASWVARSDDDSGIIDFLCGTVGANYDKLIIPAGGCRLPRSAETAISKTDASGNVRSQENAYMDGLAILSFANTRVPAQVKELLRRNHLTVETVDLFVLHQASKIVLDSLARLLRIPPQKMYTNLAKIGNTNGSTIPIALRDALDDGTLKKGATVLISGFGTGLSFSSMLLKW